MTRRHRHWRLGEVLRHLATFPIKPGGTSPSCTMRRHNSGGCGVTDDLFQPPTNPNDSGTTRPRLFVGLARSDDDVSSPGTEGSYSSSNSRRRRLIVFRHVYWLSRYFTEVPFGRPAARRSMRWNPFRRVISDCGENEVPNNFGVCGFGGIGGFVEICYRLGTDNRTGHIVSARTTGNSEIPGSAKNVMTL